SQRGLNGQPEVPRRQGTKGLPAHAPVACSPARHAATLTPVGASVTLVTAALVVDPGQEVSAEVRVRNTGSVVDEFTLDVLGDAAGWAAAEPAVLSLFPGAEGTAKLVLRPPRVASTLAGVLPYALRARS